MCPTGGLYICTKGRALCTDTYGLSNRLKRSLTERRAVGLLCGVFVQFLFVLASVLRNTRQCLCLAQQFVQPRTCIAARDCRHMRTYTFGDDDT